MDSEPIRFSVALHTTECPTCMAYPPRLIPTLRGGKQPDLPQLMWSCPVCGGLAYVSRPANYRPEPEPEVEFGSGL